MKKFYFVVALVASLVSASANAQLFGGRFSYGVIEKIDTVNLAAIGKNQDTTASDGVGAEVGGIVTGGSVAGIVLGSIIGGAVGAVAADMKTDVPGFMFKLRRDDGVLVTAYSKRTRNTDSLVVGDRVKFRAQGRNLMGIVRSNEPRKSNPTIAQAAPAQGLQSLLIAAR